MGSLGQGAAFLQGGPAGFSGRAHRWHPGAGHAHLGTCQLPRPVLRVPRARHSQMQHLLPGPQPCPCRPLFQHGQGGDTGGWPFSGTCLTSCLSVGQCYASCRRPAPVPHAHLPGHDLTSASRQLPPLRQAGCCPNPPVPHSVRCCRTSEVRPLHREDTRNAGRPPRAPQGASPATPGGLPGGQELQASPHRPLAADPDTPLHTRRPNNVFFSVATRGRVLPLVCSRVHLPGAHTGAAPPPSQHVPCLSRSRWQSQCQSSALKPLPPRVPDARAGAGGGLPQVRSQGPQSTSPQSWPILEPRCRPPPPGLP